MARLGRGRGDIALAAYGEGSSGAPAPLIAARLRSDAGRMSQDDEQTITALLTTAFMAAVDASRPTSALPPFVSDLPRCERTIVLGAGKAASAMARIVERRHPRPCTGLVVTRYGHLTDDPPRAIEVVEARHPVPDAAGMEAARRILALASAAGPGDRVIFLISGGGSALLSLPSPGVSLAEKQALNAFLLASGAPIDAIMNAARTGEIGDGRVFVIPIEQGRIIRTGERDTV